MWSATSCLGDEVLAGLVGLNEAPGWICPEGGDVDFGDGVSVGDGAWEDGEGRHGEG